MMVILHPIALRPCNNVL